MSLIVPHGWRLSPISRLALHVGSDEIPAYGLGNPLALGEARVMGDCGHQIVLLLAC
jgi:hypothetical protein